MANIPVDAANDEKTKEPVWVQQEEAQAPPPPPAPAPVLPAAPSVSTFEVTLRRESTRTSWGFFVDLSDSARVHICRLADGQTAAADYNKTIDEEEQMRVFDYVVALNGTRLDSDGGACEATAGTPDTLMAGLSSLLVATLTLQRPSIFDATVQKNGEPMGLDINWSTHGASFGVISVLDEGAARRCAPPLQAGDRIIAVNGTKGTPDVLQKTIREAGNVLSLTISRRTM